MLDLQCYLANGTTSQVEYAWPASISREWKSTSAFQHSQPLRNLAVSLDCQYALMWWSMRMQDSIRLLDTMECPWQQTHMILITLWFSPFGFCPPGTKPATHHTKSSSVASYELAPLFRVSNQSNTGSSHDAGPSHPVSQVDNLHSKQSIWAHIARGTMSEEVMERAIKFDPYMVANNIQKLQSFIKNKFPLQMENFVS